MVRLLFTACLLILTNIGAHADVKKYPEIITFNDTAFSWPVGEKENFKKGMPIRTWDVVAALDEQSLTEADCSKWSVLFKGVTWCFSSETNLKTFENATGIEGQNRYEPFLGGRCVLGTSWGIPAATGDPRTFRVIKIGNKPTLHLQSHNKWWSEYLKDEKENRARAALAHRIYVNVGAITLYEAPKEKATSKK